MSNFVVRVELHNASEADYEKLHKAMSVAGYKRHVVGGYGASYQLPSATYDKSTGSATPATVVRDQVQAIADSIRANAWVYVNRYDDSAWCLAVVAKAA